MLTLAQVKNSSVANVAGVNVNDPQFIELVNDAVQQLIDIGNWWGTVQAMVGVCANGRVVWPVGVETVLALRHRNGHAVVRNYWFDFVPVQGDMAGEFGRLYRNYPRGCSQSVVRFSGTVPVFFPPSPSNPFAVQATVASPADYGKTITIYGKDTNDQEVVTKRADGSTQRGELLTLAAVAPTTSSVFASISHVAKDVTVSYVTLWVYNPPAMPVIVIATYSGPQTSPEYLFSDVHGLRCCCDHVEALVQFGFRPVSQDSDILSLDCLDAIKCQVQAIKARDAGDPEKSMFYEKMAIRRLNMQMRSRFPMEQFELSFRPFGNDTLERQKIGYLL